MKKLTVLLIASAGLLATSCQSSADKLANQFDAMVEIANAYPNDCEAMGKALNNYIAQNKAELEQNLGDKGNASAEESKHIYDASFNLHEKTKACNNDAMNQFRRALAELTLNVLDQK